MVQLKRLLVIEDDLNMTLALYRALSHTYKVDTAKTASSGLKKIDLLRPDLIIMDLYLPDMDGLQITQQIRASGINTPVLILSGETNLINKVDLLDNGANDYVTKPFSLAELRARIRVLLRYSSQPSGAVLVSDHLTLDARTRQVIRNGQTASLRRKEFALLECLLRHAGTAVSRTYLQDYAWGTNVEPATNSLDVHIKSLRDKIDRGHDRPLIKTVHGLGYMLETSHPRIGAV